MAYLGTGKASPRGRGSHTSSRASRCVVPGARFCFGSRDPRRMAPAQPPEKLRPRSGLPHIEPVPGAALCRTRAFAVVAATRGEWRRSVPEKLRPGVGPLTKAARAWRHPSQIEPVHGAALCRSLAFSVGAATPRRMATARCPKNFAPRAGLPQIEPVRGATPTNRARTCRYVVHVARFSCGRRDPRRTAPARCPKSFAPGSGLPRKQPVRGATLCKWRAFSVGGATRGEWLQLGAGKASPRRRACYSKSTKNTRVRRVISARA